VGEPYQRFVHFTVIPAPAAIICAPLVRAQTGLVPEHSVAPFAGFATKQGGGHWTKISRFVHCGEQQLLNSLR
jgi:hypothetical protein